MEAGDNCGVVTLQWADPRGAVRVRSYMSVLRPGPGATRSGELNRLVDEARQAAKIPPETSAVVLFISLEPNQLGGQ